MDKHETKMLRQEIESLKIQFADLRAAQNNDRAEAIKAIGQVHTESCQNHKDTYEYLSDIYDLLWPVLHKTFPQYADVKKRIDAIIKRPGKGAAGREKS